MMKIESIRILRIENPIFYPFRTAFGDNYSIETVLVQLSSSGANGWGEAASWSMPLYSSECAASQFLVSRYCIAPLLLGKDISSGAELQDMLSGIKGNYFAKAGFDLAWWDLYARLKKLPLWKIIGGKHPVVDSGADFGVMDSIDELLNEISKAKDQGYKRIKLKYRPGWELNMLQKVRAKFPDIPIHIDCNSAYNLSHIEMFRELDNYNLSMIEQPLAHDDLIDHSALQRQLKTPICLDESIVSIDKVRKAIQIGACRWINIKLGRTGGITNALEINRYCEEHNIPCWVGSMADSAFGASHNIAFATLSNIRYPSDIFPTSRFFKNDLGMPLVQHSGPSQFKALEEPGIGIIPDEEYIVKVTLEEVVL
jgi:o-succinylbenzoate synthase